MLFTKPTSAALLFLSPCVAGLNVLLSNDDGWATANIRALKQRLEDTGYKVLISAPSDNRSGTGNSSTTPTLVGSDGCEFGTCPPGSPAVGHDPNDTSIWYVHAYPVDAVRYGISTLAPQFFGGPPDLVLAGPNEGTNLGSVTTNSGTFGAAKEGVIEGIPSIAFSGFGSHRSYTTLGSPSTDPAYIMADLAVELVQQIVASGSSFLPPKSGLNVNFANVTADCATPSDFEYIFATINPSPDGDPCTCGARTLPSEASVINGTGCYVSVSSFFLPGSFYSDKATETDVLARLNGLVGCIDNGSATV
ncbi:hypothetical protein BOTBODRAFT_34309 [Botryobasidium botryosum FD-172 SS1]|uniref:Survival protein SurE-like phosphatase/nucleotidase domain-containing protein n=1 Tax=Botryobasidium botryosum (strain FD-172 SS1) TaxID=930990 RepID=A0A067MCZ3_BOTB1|nr:hypothetical protein BOTBODRAFT_34309 [Botryobasidium botryosum FD-172 SS1]